MAKKTGWFSSITREGVKEALWDALRSWLWPILAPAIAAGLGFLQGLPLMYIFLGSLAAFALITHGLVKIYQWRLLRSPADKLDFDSPYVAAVYDLTDPNKINGINLGVNLKSHALFPMEVELEKLNVVFDNRIPPPADNRPIVNVGINGTMFFTSNAIDVIGLPLNNRTIIAKIEFTAKYGYPGKRIYSYSRDTTVIFEFDSNGYYKSHQHYDTI